MPVTLKDIAKRVGKSVPTVSRALGNHADISPETRAEVQRVARELGYEPSAIALNLRRRRAGAVSLISPAHAQVRFSDPFFAEFLNGVVEAVAEQHIDLLVTAGADEDAEALYLKQIRSRRTDGFIVVRTQRTDSRINLLREQGVPFVAYGRTEENNDFCFVDEDGAAGIALVVDHLASLNHRRIAYISEPLFLTKAYHRMMGFRQGLERNNLPFHPELFVETHFRQRSGRQAAAYLLDLPEPPTAIVAANDLLALGAMHEAQARGLVVGRDVSITGFDDIPLTEYVHPALTTVHLPAQEFGRRVAQMLLKLIDKAPLEERQFIYQPALVVRNSSGPAPG
ncbi:MULTISPECIES: LacI family DNA-binding transcriptional regulator [Caldilinea]|uniref:Putative LacI family transcriptional regulator n=1 Tax=Caldilinea aerophila (strain DSM 14535 / JCM 11387 / NBRC 104270 / STL-6-O1) TaxID=926550 RepID=I0I993_CALAS|nr:MULTISPECIES: LacI family DNA-binding transcriptional regulator [Caldilinea]BAM01831.1 putative LacI family transcriptional regulator [Caldilinea aerophila DSM 14535 = NBRC 104270]GIV73166.1 MAG: LacI family transcriptional regulator [Caldilinea sp.]